MDISIQGPGVAAEHCFIENKAGILTLNPCGNQCTMDGLPVTKPVRLSQGMSNMMCSHFECQASPHKSNSKDAITLMMFHSSS